MKKSTRALLGMIVLNVLIAGGAWWLIMQVGSGALNAPDPNETVERISTVAGGAIGVITAVLLLAFVYHKKKGN